MVGPHCHRLRKLDGRVVSVCAERWQLEMLSSAGNVDQSRWDTFTNAPTVIGSQAAVGLERTRSRCCVSRADAVSGAAIHVIIYHDDAALLV